MAKFIDNEVSLYELRKDILKGAEVLIVKTTDHGKRKIEYLYYPNMSALHEFVRLFQDMNGREFRRWKRGKGRL